MPSLLLDLEVDRVDLVDEGANSAAFIKLYKRKESNQPMTFEEMLAKLKPEHAELVREEVEKARAEVPEATEQDIVKLRADLATAAEQLEIVSKAKPVEPTMEEVIKSLDPAVQEVFKSLQTQKEAAEEVLKQMRAKEVEEVAITKAKELKSIPVAEDKLVSVVKGVSDEVFEVLKAAAKAIETGVLEEIGKGKGEESNGDAWAKIEKKAEEIEKRDSITKAHAVKKAIKEFPELYREYLEGGAN